MSQATIDISDLQVIEAHDLRADEGAIDATITLELLTPDGSWNFHELQTAVEEAAREEVERVAMYENGGKDVSLAVNVKDDTFTISADHRHISFLAEVGGEVMD